MKWQLAIALLMWSAPVQAQIRPDQTLPDNSIARPNGNTIDITGGTTAGSNLFHSFEQFDLRNGAIAHFQNAAAIENIFSRVTGNDPSRIDGLIRANGTANLFLLNPNGILFGENAALNIGGSFLATTADRIDFADGTTFRATAPQATPLLTVSAPIGLQFGSNPGAIVNESIAETNQPLGTDDSFVGLSVNPGETIALMGGDIRLPGGELTAPAGQIELGSVAGASRVRFTANRAGWQFGYADVQAFGDITISAIADVDASGDRGGRIRLWGDRILLTDGLTFVRADTLGSRDGDGIFVRSTQLLIQDGASIRANTVAAGQGGNISLFATDSIVLQDVERGRNGEPIVNAEGRLDGASGLFARVQPGATGSGGNISIATDRLSVLAGAQISTSTFSGSPAGRITVRASAVEVAGVAVNAENQPILSGGVSAIPSTLSTFAATTATGRAGDLTIFTDRLTVQDGATIQTSTQGVGNAGNLQIEANESIELIGTLGSAQSPTGLLTFSGGIPDLPFSRNNRNATGRGGRLTITTGELILREGAVVAVGSLNPSSDVAAGNLRVQADTLRLDQAAILANTNSGNGGSAIFNVENAIVLRGNSRISTTAGVAGSGGNGGDIRINTDFILSTLPENNDITANAFTGNGGNVTIAAQGILGIAPQQQLTTASDITASSEFGSSGAIVITNPTTDPSQGLVELPANLIDASRQIAQGCGSAAARQSSEFVVTGRSGLPPSPIDSRSSAAILSQWATIANADETMAAVATPAAPSLVEAQGWVTTANGEVRLVAAAPIAPAGVTIACN